MANYTMNYKQIHGIMFVFCVRKGYETMPEVTLQQLLLICPLVFFAGLVDSIAGGGGIISLPAYIFAGVPYHLALGTNKFASTMGTTVATARFVKKGKLHLASAGCAIAAALVGSPLGALLALRIDEAVLRYVLIVMLPVLAVFILTNKSFRTDEQRTARGLLAACLLSALAGFVVGAYDGFFGPGTGTFLILIFNAIIGFDILTASGNAKAVNLASNIAALITFLLSDSVVFALAVPAAVFGIAGNYVGAGLALKNGMKIIRPAFIAVLALLLGKLVFDLLQ